MRSRLYILLGSSILLTGCPMGGSPSSLRTSKSDTAPMTSAAVAELASPPERDDPAPQERPIIVRRDHGSPLEVHADKMKTNDEGGALSATIVSKGATIAQDVPLDEISSVALEPNTAYVVQVADVSDPAQPEPVEQIAVVTPARPPEISSVESLGGDRLLVEIDLRDNPPGTPIALGAASAGAGEPDLLLDPRTGAPLPAGAEPFIDPSVSATADAPVEEQAAEAATVGVELGATVGASCGGDGSSGDAGAALCAEPSASGSAAPSGDGADPSSGASTLLVVVSMPSAGADVGVSVQAQNDQGVTTGWSEPVSPASALVDPEIVDEQAEDARDDAAAAVALAESAGPEVEEPAVAPATPPAPDASAGAMIAWLRVRIAAVRHDLREARAALADSRREQKTAKAELRAAEHEQARLQKAGRKQKGSDKSPDVDPTALAAARLAVDTARATADEAERGLAQRKERRKELRTSLDELIDELRTRRAAVP